MKNRSVIIPLIFILFVVTAVPAIVAISVNGNSMRENSEEAIYNSVLAKMQANQEFCDELLTQYINEALDFVLERQYVPLSRITTYEELNSSYENIELIQNMNTRLKNFVERSTLVHSAFFYIDDTDYLVSTDRGLVKLNDYEDIVWLRDIIAAKKTPSGIWWPRKMLTSSGKEEDVISYLYRSNSLYTASKVSIVININEDRLSRLIYPEDFLPGGEGYLLDGSGNVLAHSNKALLYEQLPDALERIAAQGADNGILNEKNTIFAYRKSSLYDWIYVNTFSTDIVFAGSGEIFRWSIVMTLFAMLIGVVCAVFLAFRITRPVRALADKMKDLNLKKEDELVGNELTFLSNALEQIKEREQLMESTLEERKEELRRKAALGLMEGDMLQEEEKQAFDGYFRYQHYLVCLLTADDSIAYQENTTHEQRKIFRNMVFEYARELIPKEYIFDCVRYDVMTIGILVNIKSYDSEKIIAKMSEALTMILENYRNAAGWTMTAGVSLVHNDSEGIKCCAEEASQALGRRLLEGKGKIFFAHRFRKAKTSVIDCYQNQKRIMNYLELGESAKMKEELSGIVRALKEQDGMSADNVMLVFHQILGNILIYLNRHNYSAGMVLHENQKNMYAVLAEKETVEEIASYLERVLNMIVVYQEQEDKEAENGDYSQRILKYMKQNYYADIDFEDMAAQIGISYSYARKIIRDSTGKSLIECLNQIRVNEAKKLLERGNISMNEITEAVGYHNVQSLYRFFKKYEGVSPSTWREGLSEKQD